MIILLFYSPKHSDVFSFTFVKLEHYVLTFRFGLENSGNILEFVYFIF